MANLSKDYQPTVKDASSVLVGVAQIRCSVPSVRPAGTASVKGVQFTGTSNLVTDTSTGTSIDYVTIDDMSTGGTLPAGCTIETGGTYTGDYDGCFIIRAVDASTVDIFGPNAYKDAGVTVASFASTPKDMKLGASEVSGATIEGVLATTLTAGMTFIVPVWSGSAQDKVQTGIVSPYSPFSGSNESVGGLKAASFTPKLDSIKVLEAGFPSIVFDQVVEKTSVDVTFEALEYENANIKNLKDMVSQIINEAKMPSVAIELVARTRGGKLKTFFIPNANLTTFPSIAPVNDYSTLQWALAASKQTEITSETPAYNLWLNKAPVFSELTYIH